VISLRDDWLADPEHRLIQDQIDAGWSDVPGYKIPPDFRTRRPPTNAGGCPKSGNGRPHGPLDYAYWERRFERRRMKARGL